MSDGRKPGTKRGRRHPARGRALALLAGGRSDTEAAEALGVSRSTVWKWRTDPAFAVELEKVREKRIQDATARLDALVADAVEVLAIVLRDAEAPTMLRLRAAAEVLDRAGLLAGEAAQRRMRREFDANATLLLDVAKRELDPEAYGRLVEATVHVYAQAETDAATRADESGRL